MRCPFTDYAKCNNECALYDSVSMECSIANIEYHLGQIEDSLDRLVKLMEERI